MDKITRQRILSGDYKGRIRVRRFDKWENVVPILENDILLFDGMSFSYKPKEGEVIQVNNFRTEYTE